MAKRIGPKMAKAVWIVERHTGIVTRHVAKRLHIATATGRNNALGYNPINRAIAAGLLVSRVSPHHSGTSFLLTMEQDNAMSAITAFALGCK